MSAVKLCARTGWIAVILAGLIVVSSPAMASTPQPGCGDDEVGDIGDVTPVVVLENQSSTYDYTHCFTGGNTAGWNHTETPGPSHGTLTIVGSVVTYTPNASYTGPDSYFLSTPTIANPSGTLGGDGALHDACGCNITAHFNVQAPAVATPIPGTWDLFLMVMLLLGMGFYRLRAWR